jgi:hypothetical protein
MSDNELKDIWKRASVVETINYSEAELLHELKSNLGDFEGKLKNRDRLEMLAGVFIVITFGLAIFHFPALLSKIGLGIGAIYGLVVISVLRQMKIHRNVDASLPMREYLVNYRRYLLKEKSLLDYVVYWYILPPAVSVFLFFVGLGLPVLVLCLLMGFVLCLYTFIYFLNKKAVKNDFVPLIAKIENVIAENE